MRVWCSRQHSGLPSRYRGFDPRHALHRRVGQAGGSSLSSKRPGERSDGVCAERRGSFPALPLRGQGTLGVNNAVPWTAIF